MNKDQRELYEEKQRQLTAELSEVNKILNHEKMAEAFRGRDRSFGVYIEFMDGEKCMRRFSISERNITF